MSRIVGGFQEPTDIDDHDVDISDEEPEPIRDQPPWPYFLIRQEVEVEINFLERSLKGRTDIIVHAIDFSSLNEIAIDARQCQIDTRGITVQRIKNGTPVAQPTKASATYKDPHELLKTPKLYRWNAEHAAIRRIRLRSLAHTRDTDLPADDRRLVGCTPVDGSLRVKIKNEERSAGGHKIIVRKPSATGSDSFGGLRAEDEICYLVSIPFETKNIRDGLQFVGVDPGDARYTHAYTLHSYEPGTACSLFPCLDDHGSIGDWKISIKSPRTLGDALHQPLVTQRQHPNGNNGVDGGDIAEGPITRHDLSEEDKLLEMTVVCSGLLTDEIVDAEDDHKKIMTFESEKAMSIHKIGFAVGPFEHVDLFTDFRTEEDDERLGASALKIHGYCLPRRADLVRNTCVALATAADFLSLTFSGYPFDSYKLCFVEDMVDDTVPLYSISFVSTRLLHPETIIDTEVEVTRKLVHSLASQWSGVCVIPNTRRDRWVTTGIAYYMTDLFMKKLCGNNEYRFQIKVSADKLVDMDVGRPSLFDLGQYLHVGAFEREFMDLKAPLVLFILDKRIAKATSGSHNLTQILSRLFTKAKIEGDNIITTKSFRKLCEKTSKYTLDTFWSQWVYGAGCPRIKVTHRFNKKRLCVEMTISQTQSPNDAYAKDMQTSEFLRAIKEKQYKVTPGAVQPLFTGPITIRIHEADGTPYEHIVEIRDDTASNRTVRFDIPYNTKYKRLKRRREKKQATAAGAAERGDGAAGGVEEGFIYCLGDTINTPTDMEKFQAEEYNEMTERQMDAESYEWLRVDTDFEWLCSMQVGMAHYMFVSQLQQDRDVVAQEDTMLYIQREAPHPVASTVLARTLMDIKYFHGIRTMAARLLRYQCNEAMGLRGMIQLEMAYRELFCFPGTTSPRPNDFSDKRQYVVQCAIPESLSLVRDKHGKCPLRVKRFLLELFQHNNNGNNEFSDNFFVATLIKAVANTFIVEKSKQDFVIDFEDEDEEQQAIEEKRLLKEALEEINRHLRRDEWAHSYHNILTVAGLEAKRRLMKAGVIPVDALDFVKYLQDTTTDEVRIKSWEALVDLGFMVEPIIFRLFMCVLSTDRSPYVRHRLLGIFCEGLASIAFGEYAKPKTATLAATNGTSTSAVKDGTADGEGDLEMGDMDSGLEIVNVEATDKVLQAKREMAERKRNLRTAMAALKKEMETTYGEIEKELQAAVWRAIESPVLGRAEKITLLELCATMFDEADRWIISLRLPKRWAVTRPVVKLPGRFMMNFRSFYRTKPVHTEVIAPPAVAATPTPVEPKRPAVILARSSSIKVNRPSISGLPPMPATPTAAPKAPPASERPSIAVSVPRRSIAVSVPRPDPAVTQSTPSAPPKHSLERKNTLTLSSTGGPSTSKSAKRAREANDGSSPTPVLKRPKINPKITGKPHPFKSRIVTLRHPRLGDILRKLAARTSGSSIKASGLPKGIASPTMSSIQAKPARKPLPSGVPSGPSQSPSSSNGGVGTPNGAGAVEPKQEKPRPIIKLKIKPRQP
ncbi:related to TSM1 - component of TFIID complex [Cephalotrichum gorgonifer]|uniref:Transcription initiation factor TFIID subunit 2 n=1 Tax=Cephalotrichum gorgonifer TaxID=2041049 RepID=A0AAE8T067_9PEZI|nr:related to TSM1 - component of TFIID complex [Cephalotrichum gorgonifer]